MAPPCDEEVWSVRGCEADAGRSGSLLRPGSGGTGRARSLALLVALALMGLGVGPCDFSLEPVRILAPAAEQLSATGPLEVHVRLPLDADLAQLALEVDGQAADPAGLQVAPGEVRGALTGLGPGSHELVVRVPVGGVLREDRSRFTLVHLDRPDQCEVLNQVASSYGL